MIQDIAPHHFNVEYKPIPVSSSSPVLIFMGGKTVMRDADHFYRYEELKDQFEASAFLFLFYIDDEAWFLLDPHSTALNAFTEGMQDEVNLFSVRRFRALSSMHLSFAGYTGWHIYNWYMSNRFCGKCGTKTELGTDERKMVCPHCGNMIYPRINPCVIVAVHDGDRLLMTKYANRPVNWFVLIAGFCEIGESAEDTVRREVMEEAGVRIKNIRYFGSQPWGIPGNLTLGYTAELDGSDEITLDTDELAEGAWIERSEVPVPNDSLSITAAMIRAFKEGQF